MSDAPDRSRQLRRCAPWLLLVPACWLLCWWLWPAEFYWDDEMFIVDNQATWLAAFTSDTYAAAGVPGAPDRVFRPVGIMMLRIQRDLIGTGVGAWGLLSLLLHSVNSGLLASLLHALGLAAPLAVGAGLVWGLSPVQSEALRWSCVQFDLWASMLLFSSALLLRRGGAVRVLLAVLLYGVAMTVKETSLAALPVLAVIGALRAREAPKTPPPNAADDLRAGWAVAPLGGILAVSYLQLRTAVGVHTPPTEPRPLALFWSYGAGLMRGLGLSDGWQSAGGPPFSPVLAGTVGALLAVALIVAALRARRWLTLSVAGWAALPLPGLLYGQLADVTREDPDRYFYLGWILVPGLAAVLLDHAWRSRDPEGYRTARLDRRWLAGFAALVLWLGVQTVRESRWWGTLDGAIERSIEVGRQTPVLWSFAASRRLADGRPCDALEAMERAFEIARTEHQRATYQQRRAWLQGQCTER